MSIKHNIKRRRKINLLMKKISTFGFTADEMIFYRSHPFLLHEKSGIPKYFYRKERKKKTYTFLNMCKDILMEIYNTIIK